MDNPGIESSGGSRDQGSAESQADAIRPDPLEVVSRELRAQWFLWGIAILFGLFLAHSCTG